MREIIKEWLTALRSGDFKQGYNALKINNSYCCLGVLCSLELRRGNMAEFNNEFVYDGTASMNMLPVAYSRDLNITQRGDFNLPDIEHYFSLTELNDDGFSFDQIADIVEYVERWDYWIHPDGLAPGVEKLA